MNIIVAVDNNWAIGFKGELLTHIPEDMKYFKKMTIGQIVIMGRKTYESLPGKKPLKDRINIILSKKDNLHDHNLYVFKNVEEIIDFSTKNSKNSFIIGGEQIYKLFLPYCEKAYVTKIYNTFKADKFFPILDDLNEWKIIDNSDIRTNHDGTNFQFFTYKNIQYTQ